MLFVEMAFDIFQDDDGIIGQHTQCEDDRCINDDIEFSAGEPYDCHCREKYHRYGESRSDDRTEISQKEHDNQQGEDDSITQCFEHVGIGCFDQISLCVGDTEVDVRIAFLQFLHLLSGCF